jgi:hypothetical protein
MGNLEVVDILQRIRHMKRFLLLLISFIVVLTAPLLHAAEAAEPLRQRQDVLINDKILIT